MSRKTRRYRTDHRRFQRREPRIEAMEPRLLLSVAAATEAVEYLVAEEQPPMVTIHAPLSSRGSEKGGPENAPLFTGFPPVILGEDDNDFYLDLTTAFENPGGGHAGMQFQVLSNSNPQLFDSATIVGHRLRLDLARHAFGNANVRIRAVNATAQSIVATLPVTVLPVNDRPTTTGFPNLVLQPNQTRIDLNLFASFSDVEDQPHQLTYTITQNTRPELFESITFNPTTGILSIQVKPGVQGTSTLTIRATDTGGAYVEMTTRGKDFKVYDAIEGELPHVDTLQLDSMNIVTSWWLFEQVDGQYVFDHLYESQLRYYLNSQFFDPTRPTVFNIENEYFDNHPSGRELRAQVMRIVAEERPDAINAGFYAYLPQREWHGTVDWRRSQDDVQRGLFTWYALNYGDIQQANLEWQEYNARWRSAPLSDGSFVSDYISAVYPSMYTFYRYGHGTYAGPEIIDIEFSGATGKFRSSNVTIVNGLEVRFNASNFDGFPPGFNSYTEYYVVDSDGSSFRLSATLGGPAIELNPQAQGSHFLEIIGPRNYIGYDSEVIYWRYYLEENVAEARKYNVPVYAYLSPSFAGVGGKFLDENFFRMQLELSFQYADSIVVYDPGFSSIVAPENLGWYRAISDFLSYLKNPTQFQITVDTSELPSDEGKMRGKVGPRVDRFTGIAFAAATSRQSAAQHLLPGPGNGDLPTELITKEILGLAPYSAAEVSKLGTPSRFLPTPLANGMPNNGGMSFAEDDDQVREISVQNAMEIDQSLAYLIANEYLEGGTFSGMKLTLRAGSGTAGRFDGALASRESSIMSSESNEYDSVFPPPNLMNGIRVDTNVIDHLPNRGSWWRAKLFKRN